MKKKTIQFVEFLGPNFTISNASNKNADLFTSFYAIDAFIAPTATFTLIGRSNSGTDQYNFYTCVIEDFFGNSLATITNVDWHLYQCNTLGWSPMIIDGLTVFQILGGFFWINNLQLDGSNGAYGTIHGAQLSHSFNVKNSASLVMSSCIGDNKWSCAFTNQSKGYWMNSTAKAQSAITADATSAIDRSLDNYVGVAVPRSPGPVFYYVLTGIMKYVNPNLVSISVTPYGPRSGVAGIDRTNFDNGNGELLIWMNDTTQPSVQFDVTFTQPFSPTLIDPFLPMLTKIFQ